MRRSLLALLCAAAGQAGAASCASYCHWEQANCVKDPHACGGCDMCKQAEAQPLEVITAKANAGSGQCARWCNAHHWSSHCDRDQCRNCPFCPADRDVSRTCGAWCREGNGIYAGTCTDERCSGCSTCKAATQCTPVDQHDLKVESCERWCNAKTAQDHCDRSSTHC